MGFIIEIKGNVYFKLVRPRSNFVESTNTKYILSDLKSVILQNQVELSIISFINCFSLSNLKYDDDITGSIRENHAICPHAETVIIRYTFEFFDVKLG